MNSCKKENGSWVDCGYIYLEITKYNKKFFLNKIKNFENLKIIPRNNVMYGTMEFQMNPELPHYGQVEYYPVTFYTGRQYQMQRVHYSRVIEIKGIEIPSSEASLIPMEFRYWGL